MLVKAGEALATALRLNSVEIRLLIRVGWVLLVSTHIAWVCGWLVGFGLSSPFASAGDVEELKANARLSLQIQIQGELRTYKSAWCNASNDTDKTIFMRKIDELRSQLRTMAKIEDGVGEPRCPNQQGM